MILQIYWKTQLIFIKEVALIVISKVMIIISYSYPLEAERRATEWGRW